MSLGRPAPGVDDHLAGSNYAGAAWLASQLSDAAIGLVVAWQDKRWCVRGSHGVDLVGELPESEAFAAVIARYEPWTAVDIKGNDALASDPWLQHLPNVRAVAAFPLTGTAPVAGGLLLVADTKPRPRWSPPQCKRLEALARQLACQLALERQCELQRRGFDAGIRFLADELGDLVAILDRSGRRLYNNPAIRELLGDPAQLLGTDPFEQIHPDDRPRMRRLLEKTMETKQGAHAQYRFLLADGTTREMESKGTPILDAAGEVDQMLIVSRDLTKRAKFQKEEKHRAEQLQRRHSEMVFLNQMANLLHRCESTEEMQRIFAQYERGLFPESSGAVFVFNPGLRQFEVFVGWGNAEASREYFSKDECWAVRVGGLHVVEDFDPRRNVVCGHLKERVPPPYLCVNVGGQGDTNVVLHLQLPPVNGDFANAAERSRWISAQQELASAVARHIALAIDKLEQRDYLQRRADEDRVTGLFNRSFMDEILRREVLRYARHHADERTLGIIILDIDHFKQINTRYTHVGGDYVLGQVGAFLRMNIRETDFACRYGGEEFLLIMPEASEEGLRDRAERLREGVQALQLEWHGQTIQVTLSAGVAFLAEDAVGVEDLKRLDEMANRKVEELKGAAAEALREAKHNGRNQVVVSPKSPGIK